MPAAAIRGRFSGVVVVPSTGWPEAANCRARAMPSQPQPNTNTVGSPAPEFELVEPPEMELVMQINRN
ncbi:hypothetical protein GCM10027044_33320 [Hymenobacter ruber]